MCVCMYVYYSFYKFVYIDSYAENYNIEIKRKLAFPLAGSGKLEEGVMMWPGILFTVSEELEEQRSIFISVDSTNAHVEGNKGGILSEVQK